MTAVNGHSRAPLRLLVNINERRALYKRPYLFSYLLSEPGNCRRGSINITLPHPQGSTLFLLDVNDVYTCACGGRPPAWTAAIAHDDAGPQAGTQLAGPNQPASVGGRLGHGSEEPGCLRRFITGHKSFLSLHPRTLFYWLSAGLIRADMLSVLGWTDVAAAGVCMSVCVWLCSGSEEAGRDALCVISSSSVKGYSNKCLCPTLAKF